MNNRQLYIFGDSFSLCDEPDNNVDFWPRILSKSLGLSKFNINAQMGISNEVISFNLIGKLDQITPNDYIIVQTTACNRKWFFFDKPWLCNYQFINDIDTQLTPLQYNAIKSHIAHLENYTASAIRFHHFLGWLHFLSLSRKLNILILPGFESDGYQVSGRYEVKGSLYDVSVNEFENDLDSTMFYKKYPVDPRAAHLSKDNNVILANKIYNSFTKGAVLDLTSGFKEKISSKNNLVVS